MRFFVDSCIVIEALKKMGSKEAGEIFEVILRELLCMENTFAVNAVVYSEVVYKLLVKSKAKNSVSEEFIFKLFDVFEWIDINVNVKNIAIRYHKSYRLKPNDALILATCKHYGINYLLSLDWDFEKGCKSEGISLIDDVYKLKGVLNGRDSD